MQSHYELTVGGRIGPGPSDYKEATVLNRVIRYRDRARGRPAAGRTRAGEGVEGVVTPSVKPLQHQIADEAPLPEAQHTRFRGFAARANSLAADRPDIIYAAKEVYRFMAKPADLASLALKRLGRYVRAHPRMVFSMPFQEYPTIDIWRGLETPLKGIPKRHRK